MVGATDPKWMIWCYLGSCGMIKGKGTSDCPILFPIRHRFRAPHVMVNPWRLMPRGRSPPGSAGHGRRCRGESRRWSSTRHGQRWKGGESLR